MIIFRVYPDGGLRQCQNSDNGQGLNGLLQLKLSFFLSLGYRNYLWKWLPSLNWLGRGKIPELRTCGYYKKEKKGGFDPCVILIQVTNSFPVLGNPAPESTRMWRKQENSWVACQNWDKSPAVKCPAIHSVQKGSPRRLRPGVRGGAEVGMMWNMQGGHGSRGETQAAMGWDILALPCFNSQYSHWKITQAIVHPWAFVPDSGWEGTQSFLALVTT